MARNDPEQTLEHLTQRFRSVQSLVEASSLKHDLVYLEKKSCGSDFLRKALERQQPCIIPLKASGAVLAKWKWMWHTNMHATTHLQSGELYAKLVQQPSKNGINWRP